MFSKYGSEVEYKDSTCIFKTDDNYKKIVDEIIIANENVDERSKKFADIISNFPKMRISNRENSTIKLKRNVIGMLTADIRVNEKSMTFIIDTGAEVTVLTNTAALNACIKNSTKEKVEVGSFNNKMNEMEITMAECISIGNVNIFNLPVMIMDENQLSFSILGNKIFKFDGILGWNALNKFDFEIDYKKMELRIINFNKEGYLQNLIRSSFPTILVMDEYNQLRAFGLDTGARKSWISDNLVEKARLDIVKKREQTVLGVHGKEKTVTNIVKDYKIMINNAQISFKNISTGFTGFLNNFYFDGVLGADILKGNILRVINSKGIIQLENKTL